MTKRIEVDGEPAGTLEEFLKVNEFSETDEATLRALKPGESFTGGGGAWATYTVTRVS